MGSSSGGIFLSYSRRDASFVLLYRLILKTARVRSWRDTESWVAGEPWRRSNAKAIY
jgi:hypothetical protein